MPILKPHSGSFPSDGSQTIDTRKDYTREKVRKLAPSATGVITSPAKGSELFILAHNSGWFFSIKTALESSPSGFVLKKCHKR